jgi:tripartite ATP-independent transporter DctM subunit
MSTLADAPAAAREPVLLRAIDIVAESVVIAALLGELGVVLVNVFARSVFGVGLLWTDEIARLALATMTFVGGAVAYRRGHHAFVRAMLGLLPSAGQLAALAFADLLVLIGAVAAGLSAIDLMNQSWDELTPILAMPTATIAMPLVACMGLVGLYALERLWRMHGRMTLIVGLPVGVFLAMAMWTQDAWSDWFVGDATIYTALLLFFVAVFAGLPVGFALMLASACYLWLGNAMPMVALAQNMVNGTANFVLLAIPFFVFAGLVMERGGISTRLVRFVHALVGHLRGGLLQVMVVSMYLVSGLSGSKSADVAAVGSVMREMLRREHYDEHEATAALAASAAMGETVPPSIAMLVLGSITSLSIAALFVAGIIPAAVIAVCLMVLIYARARRGGARRMPRAAFGVMARAGLGAILPLGMPVMLFAGILLGVATPTEVSSFAVLYGLALAMLVYREMSFRDFVRTTVDSATLTGMVLFILAAASAFSWSLTIANLPQRLVGLLQSVHDSQSIFLIGSIVLLIVVGSLLEGLPALNVLAPLLLPIAAHIGISQLHYGIVLVIAMGIGAFLPPAGVGFYVCCAIMRTSIEGSSRAMTPYVLVLLAGLLIVTFVPWFTLSLPHAFGFRG